MIKPGVPAPNLAPLMGSDNLRERGGVTYREIKARSLLNRCDSPRMPRRFLEMVARHHDVRLGIVTKGAILLRDLDLLETINRRSQLWVRVSLISPHADLVRRLDPWAPPPAVRIDMMRRLHEVGIDAGLGLAPILPALTDDEPSIDRLLGEVAAAGVKKMFMNVLFLRSPTKEKYLRWLAAEHPRYLEAYERAYAGRVYLHGRYPDRLKEMVRRLRRKQDRKSTRL